MYEEIDDPDAEKLSIFVATWNQAGKSTPKMLNFIPVGMHDAYFIASQECGASIETSVLLNYTGAWEAKLIEHFGKEYERVGSTYLTATHSILFIRSSLAAQLTRIETAYVATGVGDFFGNKGGIAISCNIGETSFLFVNSHFHADQAGVEQRNADYEKIEKRLGLRKEKDDHETRCSDGFERVFWAGDLNYRCNCNRGIAESLIRDRNLEPLLLNEQLRREMRSKKVFEGYREADIKFPPTYKFDVGTNAYDSSKKNRVPSWTDRILWRSKAKVTCTHYDSLPSVRTSDHKPVVGLYSVPWVRREKGGGGVRNTQSSACVVQ
ncbi:hypothetical protein AAMO2058_001100300 [Amorphochlora amoebiformis]